MQVSIDRLSSLGVVHRLFESVAASVFRPIDILLKVLFAKPNKLVSSPWSAFTTFSAVVYAVFIIDKVGQSCRLVVCIVCDLGNVI